MADTRTHRQPASGALLDTLRAKPGRGGRLTHVHRVDARTGRCGPWPAWVPEALTARWRAAGIDRPWEHQIRAAELAWSGRSVTLATGTASGKSLAYLLPALSAIHRGRVGPGPGRGGATALYLAPTKALAGDQLAAVEALAVDGLIAASFDGDTPYGERDRVRAHGEYVLTNPDMLHRAILPGHDRWARFLRGLRYVVVDECHTYRGVFGSHVAAVLRRLRRVCAHYGSAPVFVCTSATVSDPAASAELLTGLPVTAVTEDASPHGPVSFALWQPPARRSATTEAAELLADLVAAGAQAVAFVGSRRAAETLAELTRGALATTMPPVTEVTTPPVTEVTTPPVTEVTTPPVTEVVSYRGGYLPEERRELEAALRAGRVRGMAATTALELGVDVSGLDAVLLAGYPGTRASMWQQAGRAGRSGREALAVLVARDDPLDAYLVHHPDALFGSPIEATVLDPDNPHVLGPHLCAAAAELPLRDADTALFGTSTTQLCEALVERGMLRRRRAGWFWTRRDPAHRLVAIRGGGAPPVRLVESGTGRLLGTVDAAAAHASAHPGAVYVHQGRTHVVDELDLDESVAFVEVGDPGYSTSARETTDIAVLEVGRAQTWGGCTLSVGTVEVTEQVVSFVRRCARTGRVLGEAPLDLPARVLRTRAVWWTVEARDAEAAGVTAGALPGAAHAAEHASIGLLPLFASCDRWDIGGVSTARHPHTGAPSVFVYDGHPGGAGFAERGFHAARQWLAATRSAIAACPCDAGCPACVQSPKCGNGNEPLDKTGAVALLDVVLAGQGAHRRGGGPRPRTHRVHDAEQQRTGLDENVGDTSVQRTADQPGAVGLGDAGGLRACGG